MKNSIFKSIISVILTISMLFSFSALFSVNAVNQTGTVVNDSVRVRTSPTTTKDNKYYVDGIVVNLNSGDVVTILDTVDSDSDEQFKTWYHIEFAYKNKVHNGYVYTGFVKLNNFTEDVEMPEGVPEIYKPYIEQLLANHPNWKFIFYDTGYDWNDLFVTNEYGQGDPGRSLIYKDYPLSYRSTAAGNYNWRTDTWIPHDAKSWYQANTETIAYYMDPRNFLNESKVFMFENLSYDSNTQNMDGVESIIKGSFMEGKLIRNLASKDVTYQQAYMDAAAHSKVSPYHLASRTIQEVGYAGSLSITGTYSGYEGYYNYYNIGASAAANPIANGLNFAKNGSGLTDAEKKLCYIPWNTPYRAIVGGAYWIGMRYINSAHKQNTLYFQKFNTSNPNSAFMWHQYMSNIMAPSSEAPSIRDSYFDLGVLDSSFTFIIPYYRNMPAEACKLPVSSNASPNNWLSSLKIDNYDIKFDAGKTSGYELEVGGAISSVNISATTVNSKAKVEGVGTVALKEGNNTINIVVTAENGDKRTYTVNIIRNIQERIPLKSISLNKTDVSLFDGDSATLSVTYNPSTTTDDKTVTWSSSNTKVATVSNGKITAVGEGTATITAKVGNFTATCKVTVSSKIIKGDVDADNTVTIADALMIFKHKSGEVNLSTTAQKAADTDGNGKVELADALRIFKFKSGEIDKL